MLNALDYIHSIGIIHLDLKPKNIIFKSSKYKKLLLIDFGISKIFKQNKETEILGFSYCYSAPEVSIEEKSMISPKSDIFSFAMFIIIFFIF